MLRHAGRAGLGALLAIVLLAGIVLGGRLLDGDGDRRREPRADAAPIPAATSHPPTILLAQQDQDGSALSMLLFAEAAEGRGGHVLLLPPGAMTEIPAFGLDRVGSALALGGPTLLESTVENLLGIDVDKVVVANNAQLAGLVAPAGALTVDVPERVEELENEQVRVLWEEGQALVAPHNVAALLGVKGRSTDLSRLARHQAFLESWFARLAADPSALPSAPNDLGLRGVLERLPAGDVVVDVLPVEAVDGGGGVEVYKVRQADLDALIRNTMPGSMARAAASRTRVQILNGTGGVGVSQRVTQLLVQPPVRAQVLYTGNATSFDHAVTEIVFYDRSKQAVAEQIRKALGVGRLVFSRRPLDVVDVTVVVGRDLP